MLKFEKRSKNRPITISMREKGRWWTPTFLRAFFYALSFHFLGIVIFNIKPYMTGQVQTLFPPVEVNVDQESVMERGISTHLEEESLMRATLIEPKPTPPKVPVYLEPKLNREIAYPRVSMAKRTPFSIFEEGIDPGHFLDFSPKQSHPKHSFRLQVTGMLSHKKLLNTKEIEKKLKNCSVDQDLLLSYQISVEDRTGKVFWIERLGRHEQSSLSKNVKKILKNLEFERDRNGFSTKGSVDMIVSRGVYD